LWALQTEGIKPVLLLAGSKTQGGKMKKGALIAIAVILGIILVAALYICSNKDKLAGMVVEKSFAAMENAVVKNLPEGTSQDSVRTAFKNIVEKIKTHQVDKQELKTFVITFQAAFRDQKLDSTEVVQLLEGLKQLESKQP
jgi:hypothetical protein